MVMDEKKWNRALKVAHVSGEPNTKSQISLKLASGTSLNDPDFSPKLCMRPFFTTKWSSSGPNLMNNCKIISDKHIFDIILAILASKLRLWATQTANTVELASSATIF